MEVVSSNQRMCGHLYDMLSDMNEGEIVKSVFFSVCVLHPHALMAFLLSYLPPLMKCTLGEASVVV